MSKSLGMVWCALFWILASWGGWLVYETAVLGWAERWAASIPALIGAVAFVFGCVALVGPWLFPEEAAKP